MTRVKRGASGLQSCLRSDLMHLRVGDWFDAGNYTKHKRSN